MSRQNKQAKARTLAKEITALHKKGMRGPSKTIPKHGKKWSYRNPPPDVERDRIARLLKIRPLEYVGVR